MGRNNNDDAKDAKEKPSCCARFNTKMRQMGHFIYNSETHEVLGRSGLSWLKVLSFYFGFYAVLAGFWAICLVVFIRTLDPVTPTMQKMFSMLKDNPGMNFEPFPSDNNTVIVFDPANATQRLYYTDRLNEVYSEYINKTIALRNRMKKCNITNGASPDDGCQFDIEAVSGNCTPANDFGYKEGKPCVMLRINRIYLWEPNNITLDRCSMAGKTNLDCAKYQEFNNLPGHVKSKPLQEGYIAVSCEGENDGDADNIRSVQFFPPAGIPAYYFPYYNQKNYTSPIVMAQFDVIPGRVSMILCKFWTTDVVHDKNDLQGSIHFELMVGPRSV